ncbi:hypothetical protein HK098_007264 [Nowakowskiella sp. JEL0407]|nr:hypothetical protein HK098_007264 [Nowakowskiella sp. JEL0407]
MKIKSFPVQALQHNLLNGKGAGQKFAFSEFTPLKVTRVHVGFGGALCSSRRPLAIFYVNELARLHNFNKSQSHHWSVTTTQAQDRLAASSLKDGSHSDVSLEGANDSSLILDRLLARLKSTAPQK